MRTPLVAALALMATAAPAAAADDPVATWADPCADAQELVRVMGSSAAMSTARTARHDIRSTTVRVVPGGVDVVLELCGDVPAGETGITSSWSVWADVGGGCQVVTHLGDDRQAVRTAGFSLECSEPDPVIPGAFRSVVRFGTTPSFTVSGSRITWRLRSDELGEQAAATLRGVTWARLSSGTMDGARGTEAGNETAYVNGPGARDVSSTGRSLELPAQ